MNILDYLDVPAQLTAFALLTALSGTALCGLALASGGLLRRRSLPLRYCVLFAGVIGLLAVPMLVAAGQSMDWLFAVIRVETVTFPAERLDEILTSPAPDVDPVASETSSSCSELAGLGLVAAWALGVVGGMLGLVRGLWRFRGGFAGEPWQAGWWTEDRRRALADKVGLKVFPTVWRSPLAPLPMVVGLWRPRIVVPEGAPASWGQTQWEAVLLHEAAHIARRDPWAALAQRLSGVLFWWCPLVPALVRRLNHLRETICDDYALAGSCDRLTYAALLVEAAERLVHLRTLPVPVGLLDSARGGLEERITCLLEKEKRPMTKLSLAGKLLGAGVLTAACLAISAATAFSQAPPAQKKIQIKIVVDGKEIDLTDEVLQSLLAAKQNERRPEFKARWIYKQAAADPRIEALVKQAEAVKPGSGAAIRQALEPRARNVIGLWAVESKDLAQEKAKERRAAQIEDVVTTAEALAPGSGDRIRALLQAQPFWRVAPGMRVPLQIDIVSPPRNPRSRGPVSPGLSGPAAPEKSSAPAGPNPPTNARMPQVKDKAVLQLELDGKRLLFYLDDGKVVQQLRGEALKGLRLEKLEMQPGTPVKPGETTPRAVEKPRKTSTAPAKALRVYLEDLVNSPPGVQTKPTGTIPPGANPAAPPLHGRDLEALTRELQRLTAEVNELRQRIEKNKGN